jgi:hypothetical protein
MTAPERFADSQIPLAPRAPSIHDLKATLVAPTKTRLTKMMATNGPGAAILYAPFSLEIS